MLAELHEKLRGNRVLVLGVGNRLRGDDAVGSLLAEKIPESQNLQAIDAGDAPENYLGVIEAANPQIILLVDALDFGGSPGDVAFFGLDQLGQTAMSTHGIGLPLLFRALEILPAPEVIVLGIQPGQTAFGSQLTVQVQKTVEILLEQLASL